LSKKSIAKATFIVAFLGVFSKLLGFFREQLIAWFFGATGATDAYLVALLASGLIAAIISGPVSTSFLPVFALYLARDDEKGARKVASSTITLSSGLVFLLSLAAIPWVPQLVSLVAPGLSGPNYRTAVRLTRLFLPVMAIPLLAAFCKQILNSYKEFTIPALQPVVQNLIIVALVALLAPVLGVWALGFAVVAGYCGAFLVQVPALRKTGLGLGFSLEVGEGTRRVSRLALPLVLGSIFGQVYLMVDKALASHLPEGSISALSFADRLRQLPLGLFVTAVATVVYPTLSEMWGKKDQRGFEETINLGLRYVGFIVIPAAGGLSVLTQPIVRLAFQRGAFTEAATLLTSQALLAYTPGMVAMAASQIITTSFYSSLETRLPVMLSIGTAVANIGLDVVLVRFMGHVGLALANSLAAWAGVILSVYLFSRFIFRLSFRSLGVSAAKIAAASSAMGLWVWLLARITGFYRGYGRLAKDIGMGLLVAGSAVLVYLLAAWILKCEEMVLFIELVREKLGRGKKTSPAE